MKTDNNKKLFVGRAARHFVRMTLLVALLFAVMYYTDTLGVEPSELLGTRGIILAVALVAISAYYPVYGFDTVVVVGDIVRDRSTIVEALARGGYTLTSAKDGELCFRGSTLKRLRYAGGDDKVWIRRCGEGQIEISGIRREVEQARFRIVGLLGNA